MINRPHLCAAPANTPPPTEATAPPWRALGAAALIPRAEWPAELLTMTTGTGHMVTAEQWRAWHHIPANFPLWYVPPRTALPPGNTALIDAILAEAATDPEAAPNRRMAECDPGHRAEWAPQHG